MDRHEQMVAMRNQGQTLQRVGDHFGITRERVRQILKKLNYCGKPDLAKQRASEEQKERSYRNRIEGIRQWQKNNPEKIRAYRRDTQRRRREKDPLFVIAKNLRKRISNVVKGHTKAGHTAELIGCSAEELRAHLEAQFQPGMTWDNYGVFGWHVDHIKSCWRFDMSDPDQQRECFHYTNLQPLWREDNLAKRDHWEAANA